LRDFEDIEISCKGEEVTVKTKEDFCLDFVQEYVLCIERRAACLNEGWRRSRVYMLRHSTLMLKVNSAISNQCFLHSVVDLHPQWISITLSGSGCLINRFAGLGLEAKEYGSANICRK
jgi:hypothetical protein